MAALDDMRSYYEVLIAPPALGDVDEDLGTVPDPLAELVAALG